MNKMLYFFKIDRLICWSRDEKGQDLAEYALLLAFIAIVVVAAATLLGTNLSTYFQNIGNQIATWPGV